MQTTKKYRQMFWDSCLQVDIRNEGISKHSLTQGAECTHNSHAIHLYGNLSSQSHFMYLNRLILIKILEGRQAKCHYCHFIKEETGSEKFYGFPKAI